MNRFYLSVPLFALIVAWIPRAVVAGPVDDGRTLFTTRCAVCHVTTPGARSGMGPNLAGLANRQAGSAPGFVYSGPLKRSGLIWNRASLDAFLTKPTAAVPGTRMPVSLPDAKERAAVIAYLVSLKN